MDLSSKIKILFIHHAAGWGGAPNSMIMLINNLDKKKYKVKVLLLKKSIVAQKLNENNIDYEIAREFFYKKYYHYFTHSEAAYIKWYQFYRMLKQSLLWSLSRYYFAKKELDRFEYDIVHLNSSVLTDFLAPAKRKGKTILHIREPFRRGKYDLLYKLFRRQMKLYADQIIAISFDNANRIGLPEKTTIIYNYADVPLTNPNVKSYSSKFCLYLGGSAEIKGYYTLVEALDYLDKDIKICFGGNYATSKKNRSNVKKLVRWALRYDKRQKQAIAKMRNHPNAIELGMTQNVNKYFEEVCCLISPFSTAHFSRPVIEAYLHKKPAIGSDVEGMDEIIKHNVTGLLFEKDNPKALAEAINYIACHPDKAKKMGENGYRIAVKKFSPQNIVHFQRVYNSL